MENTPARTRRNSGARPLSVILGTLLIPVSALAAFAFVSPSSGTETTQSNIPIATDVGFNPFEATAEDLARACGPAGMELVIAEDNGSITDVQQAALDALREICAKQGIQLPGKAAPEPIVQQIVVQSVSAAAPSATTSAPTSFSEDDHDEDDHREDREDHEDEDEHEDSGDDD